jgi:hypothetical protein
MVQKFERAAPEYEGLRLVGAMRRLLDNANRHRVARKLDCESQSHRTGADYENILGHGSLLWKSSECQPLVKMI